MLNVGERFVKRARKVMVEGVPELGEALERGGASDAIIRETHLRGDESWAHHWPSETKELSVTDNIIAPQTVITFGRRYLGQPIEVLRRDPGYAKFLISRSWFREKYPEIVEFIVSIFGKPQETPDHNSLQVRFVDHDFCEAFLHADKHLEARLDGKIVRHFEVDGWDVVVARMVFFSHWDKPLPFGAAIEIKPVGRRRLSGHPAEDEAAPAEQGDIGGAGVRRVRRRGRITRPDAPHL